MVGGTDNGRQKTRNHGYDVIVGGELFTDSDHPRKLVTLNPKLKSTGAGRYQLLPLVRIHHKQQLPERLLSKSLDAVALQQIKERGALPQVIVVISSGNRPLQQYRPATGRWLWSVRA